MLIRYASDRQFFTRKFRLNKSVHFKEILKTGVRKNKQGLSFYVKPNNLSYGRLGFSIPKKTTKKAVTRNVIKRTIRESFRHHQSLLTGLDILIFYNTAFYDKASLKRELDSQWKSLILY